MNTSKEGAVVLYTITRDLFILVVMILLALGRKEAAPIMLCGFFAAACDVFRTIVSVYSGGEEEKTETADL